MGAFFRRILAFLLGFVMSFVTVVGGVGVGAYWAYKNLSIDKVTDDTVVSPVIDKMTIEDFVADLQQYMSDPNSYTLGEIEEKYGLDLAEAFGDFGKNLNPEYKNIQFLALFTGDTDVLLGSINLKVLTSALESQLPGMFSEKAIEQLGRSTVLDLVKEGELDQKLVDVLGTLKVGDVAGFLFEDGAQGRISSDYVLKQEIADSIPNEGVKQFASYIGNVEVASLIRAFSDGYEEDILDEIMNGGLAYIGSIDIGEFIASFIPEGTELPVDVKGMFGGKTVRDLVTGHPNNYKIEPLRIFTGMTVASVMGYTVDSVTGEVTDKDGNEVTGVLRDLATLNIGDIIVALASSNGSGEEMSAKDVLDFILGESDKNALNNVTVGSIFETVLGIRKDENGEWVDKDGAPLSGALAALSGTFDLGIMDTVRLFTGDEFTLEKVAEYLDGKTVGDFLYSFADLTKNENGEWLDKNGKAPVGTDAVLAGVMDISLSGLVRGIDSLITSSDVIPLLDEIMSGTLGKTEVGTFLSYTKDAEGKWIDGNGTAAPAFFDKLLSLNLSELENTFITVDENGNRVFTPDVVEIVDYLLSDITLNDVVSVISVEAYDKVVAAVSELPGVAKLLDTPIADIIKAFLPDEKEEISVVFGDITVNDAMLAIKNILHAFDVKVDALDNALDEIGSAELIGEKKVYDIDGIKTRVLDEITLAGYITSVQNVLAKSGILAEDHEATSIINDLKKYVADYTISTISKFDYKNILVSDVIDTVETIVTLFVKDGSQKEYINIVRDLFEEGARLGDENLLKFTVGTVVRVLADVADLAIPDSFEMKDKIVAGLDKAADICDELLTGNIPSVSFNKQAVFAEVVLSARELVDIFYDTGRIGEAVITGNDDNTYGGFIGNLYGNTTLEGLKDKTLALVIHDIIDQLNESLKYIGIGSASLNDAIATVIKEAFKPEATVGNIQFAEYKTVADVTNGIKAAIQAFDTDEARDYLGAIGEHTATIYKALDSINGMAVVGGKYDGMTFGDIKLTDIAEAGNVQIKSVISAVRDVLVLELTKQKDIIDQITDVVVGLFDDEASFVNFKLSDFTVGFISDEIKAVLNILEGEDVLNSNINNKVSAVLDHVENLLGRSTKVNEIKLANIKVYDTVDTVLNITNEFVTLKEDTKTAIKKAFTDIFAEEATLADFKLKDVTVGIVSDEIDNVLTVLKSEGVLDNELSGKIERVVGHIETLLGADTLVKNIKLENIKVYDTAAALLDVIGEFAPVKELTRINVLSMVSEIFESEATLADFKLKDVTVGIVANELRYTVSILETEKVIGAELSGKLTNAVGHVETLLGTDTLVKNIKLENIKVYDTVDTVLNITNEFVTLKADTKTAIKKAFTDIFESEATLADFKLKDVTVGIVSDEIDNVLTVLETEGVFGTKISTKITNVVGHVETLLGADTLVKNIKLANIKVYDTVDTVLNITNEFVTLKEDTKTAIKKAFTDIFESEATLADFKIKDVTVGIVSDEVDNVLTVLETEGVFGTKISTKITNVVGHIETLLGTDTLVKNIKLANIKVYDTVDTVLNITNEFVTLKEDTKTAIKKAFTDIFESEATLADFKLKDVTVGIVSDEVDNVLTVLKSEGVLDNELSGKIERVVGHIETLLGADTLVKNIKLANIKVYDTAATLLDVIGEFAPVKELTRINVLSMVSEIFESEATLADFKLKDVTVGIVANELRYTVAILETEKVIGAELSGKLTNAVGHVETLLGADTLVKNIKLANIKVYDTVDTVLNIVNEFVTLKEDTKTAIKKAFTDIFAEEATLADFKLKDVTVGIVSDEIDNVLTVLKSEGVFGTKISTKITNVVGHIETLLGTDTLVKNIKLANIKVYDTVDTVLNIVNEFVTLKADTKTAIKKAFTDIFESEATLADFKLKDVTVGIVANELRYTVSILEAEKVIGAELSGKLTNAVGHVETLLGTDTLVKNIKLANIKVYDTVDTVLNIVNEFVTLKEDTKTAIKKAFTDIFESEATLADFKLKDVTVGIVSDEIDNVLTVLKSEGVLGTKISTKITNVVGHVETLLGTDTLVKNIKLANIKVYDTVDTVLNITNEFVTLKADTKTAIKKAFTDIFESEATLADFKLKDVTVGIVSDEVDNVVTVLKSEGVIGTKIATKITNVVGHVETLLGEDTLVKNIKLANIKVYDTVDTVLYITNEFVTLKEDTKTAIKKAFTDIFESEATLADFKLKDVTVGIVSDEIDNVVTVLKSEGVLGTKISTKITNVVGHIETLLGADTLVKNIKLANIKVYDTAAALLDVIGEFAPVKELTRINVLSMVSEIFESEATLADFKLKDVTVGIVANELRYTVSILETEKVIGAELSGKLTNVVGHIETLLGADTLVKNIKLANIKVYDTVDTVLNIVNEFVTLKADTKTAIENAFKEIFTADATLADFKLKDITVGVVGNEVDNVLTVLKSEGVIGTKISTKITNVVGHVETLLGADTLVKNIKLANIKVYDTVDTVLNIVNEFVTLKTDTKTAIENAFKEIFTADATLADFKLKDVTVGIVSDEVDNVVTVLKSEGVIGTKISTKITNVVGHIETLLGTDTLVKNIKLENIKVYDTVDTVLNITNEFVTLKSDTKTAIENAFKEIFTADATLADFKLKDITVGVVGNEVDNVVTVLKSEGVLGTKISTKITNVVGHIKTLLGTDTLVKNIKLANIKVYDTVDTVLNITNEFVTLKSETKTAIENAFKEIFTADATLADFKLKDITVGVVGNEVDNVVTVLKSEGVIGTKISTKITNVVGHVETLLGADTLVKNIKLANIKVYDTVDTVLNIVNEFVTLKEDTKTAIENAFKEIFTADATLADFKIKDITVGVVAGEINNVLAVLKSEKVLGEELANKITNSVGYVENLLGEDNKLNEIDFGKLNVNDVIDTIIDITEEFIDDTEEEGGITRTSVTFAATSGSKKNIASVIIDAVRKLSKLIISDKATFTSFKFNGLSTVNELYDCVMEIVDKELPEKAQELVDIVTNAYGEVRLFHIANDGWNATKAIEIANTVKDIFDLIGIRSEYKFYELLENNGVQTTVGDFVDNTNETVKAITDKVSDIDYLNDIVSDLYFKKAFGETSSLEKAAVFGTYAGAGVLAYVIAPAKVREVIGEKEIADVIAPEKIAKNDKQQEVLEEIFDFKLVTVLDVIERKTAIRTAAKSLVENVSVGDVIGMFTSLEETEAGWTYGSETFDELATEIFEIEFTDVVSAIVKEIEFTDVFDYKNVTVGKAEGLLLDATGVINVRTGKELKITNAVISAVASILKRDTLVQNVKLEATVHSVVDALGDVAEAAGAPEKIVTASEELVKVVLADVSVKEFSQYIDKEAEFTAIYDKTENLLEVITNKRIKADSALDVVTEFVKSKLTGITIGNCKTEVPAMLKAITTYEVIDLGADVADTFDKVPEKIVTASEELVKVVLADVSVKEFSQYIDKEAEFTAIYDKTENLAEAITNKRIKAGSALDVAAEFVKSKLTGITIGNCKTEAPEMLKEIRTYELIDLAVEIADTFERIPDGVTEDAEKLLKEIAADRTVAKFKFNKDGKFVNMYDYILEGVERATGKTIAPDSLADAVVVLAKDVFADLTIGNCKSEFMNAVKGAKIYSLAEFVYDIAEVITDDSNIMRMARAAVDAVKRFVTDDSTITSIKTQNVSLGAINDALADILFESDMETLLAGSASDKAKAYVIYYLDANAGAALYMISREKVSSLLGETKLGIAPSVAGKTPAISEMIKEVKINDILRASVDKFTGKTDKNGTMSATEFIDEYFNGADIGDVIEVFLPEKVVSNKLAGAILGAKLLDVYEVVRGRKSLAAFGKETVGTLTLGDMLGISKIKYKGNEIRLYEYVKAIQLNDVIACVLPRFVYTEEYTLMGAGEIMVKYFTVDGGYIDAAMGDATVGDALKAVLPSKLGENVIGKALYGITVNDLYLAVRGYASMEDLISNAFANVSVGEVLGFEKGTDGVWYKDGKAKFLYTPNAEKLVLTDSAKYVLFSLLNDLTDVKLGKFLTKAGDENYITAIKNGNVKFGEVFGRTYDEATGKWLDEDGKEIIPLWNAMYSLNAKSFDNAVNNILEVLGDERIGELFLDVTYDEANGNWIYNPNGNKAFADGKLFSMIESNLFKMTANSLLTNGALNVENIMNVIFENIYIGNALGYAVETIETAPAAATDKTFEEIISAYGKLPEGEYKAQEGVYYVQTDETYYFLVENAAGTYDKKTVSLTDARKMEYDEYGTTPFAVGDLQYVWTNGGTQVSAIYNLISNTDLGGIINGGGIGLIDDLGWLAISDINLGINNSIIELVEDTPLCKLDEKIDEIVLADLLKYNKTEVTDLDGYTDVAGLEGAIKVNAAGEYVKAAGDKWYKANDAMASRKNADGVAATSKDYSFVLTKGTPATEVKLVESLFASLTIREVASGNGFGNIMDDINYMTLAEILGSDDPLFTDNLFKKLKDTIIKDLATEIKAMELGDIMDYTLTEVDVTGYDDVTEGVKKSADGKYARTADNKWYEAIGSIAERKLAASETVTTNDYVYVWKNNGSAIDLTEAVFASVTIGDVTNGTGDILDRMFWLTAKELLGNNISDSSTIFNLIGNEPIKNIESAINGLYVGDLMGYTRGAETTTAGEYEWFKDEAKTTEVKGFENIMANITVGGLGTTDFDAKIKGVKLKEVLTIPDGNILNAVLDDETTLGNAPDRIQTKMTNLTMGQFMEYGVVTIDADTQKKLNTLFEKDEKNWTELTMSQFISALIDKIPEKA